MKGKLVHCITNFVTVNDCANALLAVGASPIMAHHIKEVEQIQKGADALVCNLGATDDYDAMKLAYKEAVRDKHVIVIDPVGVGASSFRRDFFYELLSIGKPDCVRGNYSEIIALAEGLNTSKGVDALINNDNIEGKVLDACKALAHKTDSVVIASGVIDYLSEGDESISYKGGSALMSRVTGMGCMQSALLGAYLTKDALLQSAYICCKTFGEAGEKAEEITKIKNAGTMTFKNEFLDKLYVE